MRRTTVVLALVGAALGLVAGAFAVFAWTSSGSGSAPAASASMPDVARPAATLGGTEVTVSWTPAVFPDGTTGMTGYAVTRHPGGTEAGTEVACGTGSSATSCVDTTPGTTGTVAYRVTPSFNNWVGRRSAMSAPVTLDGTAPVTSVSSTSPEPNGAGWSNAASGVVVSLTATDDGSGVASVTYSAAPVAGQPGQAIEATTVTWAGSAIPVSVATDGQTVVSFAATDAAGNVEATRTHVVKLDRAAPTGSLGSLPALVRNGQPLSGTYGDVLSGVARVDYLTCAGTCTPATGAEGTSVAASGTSSPFGATWTGQPADGAHTLRGAVADAAGNVAYTGTRSVTVDNTAPTTSDDTATVGNAWRTSATVTLTAAGATATYYTVDGSTPTTGSASGTSIALATSGSYTVRYFSVDAAGNAEQVRTAGTTVRVDANAPTGTVTAPAANATVSQNVAVSSNAADAGGSGIASVRFQSSAGTSGTWADVAAASTATSATWDTAAVRNGAYSLRVVVTDNAGNATTSASVAVTVANPTATPAGRTKNGQSTAGTLEAGDELVLVMPGLQVGTFCPGWTGSNLNNLTVTFADDAGGGNDALASVGSCNFGRLDLGSASYLRDGTGNGSAVFTGSTLAWNNSQSRVTVTLGTLQAGGATLQNVASTVLTYTPSAAARDGSNNRFGVTVSGTASRHF